MNSMHFILYKNYNVFVFFEINSFWLWSLKCAVINEVCSMVLFSIHPLPAILNFPSTPGCSLTSIEVSDRWENSQYNPHEPFQPISGFQACLYKQTITDRGLELLLLRFYNLRKHWKNCFHLYFSAYILKLPSGIIKGYWWAQKHSLVTIQHEPLPVLGLFLIIFKLWEIFKIDQHTL